MENKAKDYLRFLKSSTFFCSPSIQNRFIQGGFVLLRALAYANPGSLQNNI